MYGLLGPVEIYYANQVDFMLKDFIFIFIEISLVVLIIGTVVISMLLEKINRFVRTLLCGFAIASYVQNMFMNVKLAQIYGLAMKWDELEEYTRINTTIYLVIFISVVWVIFIFKEIIG